MLFYRFFAAAVGFRTGAGKIWRKHANSRLPILVYYLIYTCHRSAHGLKIFSLFLFGLSTGNIFANFDSDDESEWSEKAEESEESS